MRADGGKGGELDEGEEEEGSQLAKGGDERAGRAWKGKVSVAIEGDVPAPRTRQEGSGVDVLQRA